LTIVEPSQKERQAVRKQNGPNVFGPQR